MNTKLTNQEKLQIISLIEQKKLQLKSYSSVATFLGISDATISQMAKNKYHTQGDELWLEVAAKLNWKATNTGTNNWVHVDTRDYKSLRQLAIDCKNNHLFMPISDLAGMGKTASLTRIANELATNATFYIRCWDWGKKEFLTNLCKSLGIDAGRGFKTPNDYIQMIVEFFQKMAHQKPLLIIDEADKLKASALRFLIPLYNECEDGLACLIAGTENLEKEIKRGVRYQAKGYDEINSRFGRKYIKLIGCIVNERDKTKCEVHAICKANGVSDEAVIKTIIEDCQPVRKLVRESSIRVVTDLRRLKRLIKKQLLTIQN